MKEIALTRGKVALVDDQDHDRLSRYSWYASRSGGVWYAKTGIWDGRRTAQIAMHRLLINADAGQLIDHINGNGLDNRRSNLRLCCKAQNQQNQRARKNCSSRYKGVSFDAYTGRWRAKVKAYGRITDCGRFANEEDAARAYDAAAIKVHGRFARLNFPQEVTSHEAA
jgi:hypothetical protein